MGSWNVPEVPSAPARSHLLQGVWPEKPSSAPPELVRWSTQAPGI